MKRRRGQAHHRWSGEQKHISSHGYVKLRVGRGHPLADPNGYAYEHLVVWISAGMPHPPPGYVLHHKDGTKSDNRLENLEMLARPEHAQEHHPGLISDEDVALIRQRYAAGEDGTALAQEFTVSPQRVYKIIRGLTRRSAGGPIQTGSLRKNANRNRGGKKAAGRLLDGQEWNQEPEVAV